MGLDFLDHDFVEEGCGTYLWRVVFHGEEGEGRRGPHGPERVNPKRCVRGFIT